MTAEIQQTLGWLAGKIRWWLRPPLTGRRNRFPTETETPGVGTTASASRSFEPNTNTVDSGGELMVTITAVDYGLVGRVVEMLPPGFRYMDGSIDPSGIRVKVEEDQVEGPGCDL